MHNSRSMFMCHGKMIGHNVKRMHFKIYYIALFYSIILLTGYHDGLIRSLTSTVGLIILFLFFLFDKNKKNIFSKDAKFVVLMLLSYIAYCIVTIMSSTNIAISLEVILKMFVLYFMVYLIYSCIHEIKEVKFLLKIFVVCGLIFLIAQLIDKGNGRDGGLYSNINSMGFIFSILIISTLFLYTLESKVIWIFAIFLFLIGLALTASRASIVMVVVAFAYMFVTKTFDKKMNIILISFLFILFMFAIIFHEKIIELFIRPDSGLAGRDYLWKNAINIIKDNFIFGIGVGNIPEVAAKYLHLIPMPEWRYEALLKHAIQSSHSMYLDILMEVGILGFSVFLLLNFFVFKQFFNYRKSNNLLIRKISNIIIALLLSILIRGFFEPMGIIGKGWISLDSPFWIIYSFALIVIQCLKKDGNSIKGRVLYD